MIVMHELIHKGSSCIPNLITHMETGISAMSNDNRCYHVQDHPLAMLRQLESFEETFGWTKKYTAEQVAELLLAIAWHDAVYNPLGHLNEIASANLFSNYACKVGICEPFIDRVRILILSTQIGTSRDVLTRNVGADILHDLDYMGFSNWNLMISNEAKIRWEYGMYDDETYYTGKKKFLEGLLKEANESGLYLTPEFKIQNSRASENILRHLDMVNDKLAIITLREQQDEDITVDFLMRMQLMDTFKDEQLFEGLSIINEEMRKRAAGQPAESFTRMDAMVTAIINVKAEDRISATRAAIKQAGLEIECIEQLRGTTEDDLAILDKVVDEIDEAVRQEVPAELLKPLEEK